MANCAAAGTRPQALVPSTTTQSLLPQRHPPLAAVSAHAHAATPDNALARHAFLAAGILLAGASIALAALSGWSRGASPLESAIWAGAGVALALVSLFGLSLMLAHHGAQRRAAGIAWVLALGFTVVAALGSQHGGRELAGRTESAAVGNHARHQADYDRAAATLPALPTTRPVAVIEGEIAALLQDKRLNGCNERLASWRLRKVCDEKVAPARAELANARARETAQAALTAASAALSTSTVTKPANADAGAVRRYLAAIGVDVGTERLADVLNLLTVLAVEVCGAVALVLGRKSVTGVTGGVNTGGGGESLDVNTPAKAPPGGVQAPALPALNTMVSTADARTAATIERLKRRILGELEHGPRSCSQRRLASEFGASVGYVNKALHELAAAGTVNVNTSRAGTTLALACV